MSNCPANGSKQELNVYVLPPHVRCSAQEQTYKHPTGSMIMQPYVRTSARTHITHMTHMTHMVSSTHIVVTCITCITHITCIMCVTYVTNVTCVTYVAHIACITCPGRRRRPWGRGSHRPRPASRSCDTRLAESEAGASGTKSNLPLRSRRRAEQRGAGVAA